MSSASALYQIGNNPVVTGLAGLLELKLLYAVDIEDALIWLGVVLTIEVVVLVGNAIVWFWKGHWMYGWNQLLRIGGFAAIGSNLSQWHDELKEEAVPA